MITSKVKQQEFYQALLEKDRAYDGIFFAGIKTTGIFCHPSCRARKPKFENCVFYQTAEEALLAGFRPCKICQPLSFPQMIPAEVQKLVDEVEAHPEKRWKESDFSALGLNSAAARRKFKEIYQMTFVQYARARRMGLAFKEISRGSKVIDQQLQVGYESSSGFNDAFTKIMGNPAKKTDVQTLTASFISTPIGRMLCLTDDEALYLLEFEDRRGLEREIERLREKYNSRIIYGQTAINQKVAEQLSEYFKGERREFSIPLFYDGSPFQKQVWETLAAIPFGKTVSYQEIAIRLGDKNKVRAVGRANGANKLAIIVPCHRVIAQNGNLTGYAGGLERKKYLLDLEQKYRN
ncbi:bifunctional transcriptional activator/DNA repair enzyme AdaA [Enterococcus xiangfangensis]|uniref:bifunctional transcriptional activator/DNA repair enzyme AdaA n=1 Tax=Enterococcus xiangfangensis TaxID=1296537 RepID=UPI0010F4C91C|nr:bifunctional transcriptional activator/DNA repair protein Ada [Enterococcus xiangfangensis]MBM7711234.1 AraC family transcriptional regulator of adaptative response/methylated-DNA-[protein]-cysteine methyltransferase [Enterococcus xiangfangensis]